MGSSNVEDAKFSLENAKKKLADRKVTMKRDLERTSDPARKKHIREQGNADIARLKSEVERYKKALALAKEIAKKR